jgi:hypothetical protein
MDSTLFLTGGALVIGVPILGWLLVPRLSRALHDPLIEGGIGHRLEWMLRYRAVVMLLALLLCVWVGALVALLHQATSH